MFTLSLGDGRRHSRSDDQFAALVAKMPSEGLSLSDISKPWRLMPNITHELQPGEMHCNMRNMKDQLTSLPSCHVRPLTERKLHPEIFSHGVLQAGIGVIPTLDDDQKKGMGNILGQNFQPCCWTRCFNSEEPSHECSGPLGTISC
jgi:hypothetical protein